LVEAGFRPSLDSYGEPFHSRNGYSRDRMHSDAAAAFDSELRALVHSHQRSQVVAGEVASTVTWGQPRVARRC
jgi:hypothetical protein